MKLLCFLLILAVYLAGDALCGVQTELFICQAGKQYVKNECDQCFCLEEDDFVCTMNKCTTERAKELQNCRAATVWKENCNTCWCTNVGTVCTTDQCIMYKV